MSTTPSPQASPRRRLGLALVLTAALAACDAADLAGPPDTARASAELQAGAPSLSALPTAPTGLPGFHFTDPIAPPPATPGPLDGSLLDLLTVEICRWSGADCLPVRALTAASSGAARLHVDEDGEYRVVWQTRYDGVSGGEFYRVRVLASGGELGHADVEIVEPTEDAGGASPEWPTVTRGAALPVGFIVEEGVGQRSGAEGGTIELAGGAARLTIPPGALSGDVFFTAVPVTDLPPGDPPIVPGTAWDFGPDGLEFATPAVLTIAYDPADLPPGVDESELRIHELVDGALVQQNAGLVDPVAHTVSAEIDGFSVFVVVPRDPESQQDAEAPTVRALEVFDAIGGDYAANTTLDVTAADAPLSMRLTITDDVSGVRFLDVRWRSPTGRQLRFPCYTGAPPTTGSDTNGEWVCNSVFPRYSEPGVWEAQLVLIYDRANNAGFYGPRPEGLCMDASRCIPNPATVTVVDADPDLEPPSVQSIEVSPATLPRAFAPAIVVDATAGAVPVIFGIAATDDKAGLVGQLQFDAVDFDLRGPSGQYLRYYGSCSLASGSALDGFLECSATIPNQAEPGAWTITSIRVPDRAGNGGFSFYSYFLRGGDGRLCNQTGNCVDAPVVNVGGVGDGSPPELQSVDIVADGAVVTTTLALTDDLSGVSFVRVRYESAETPQFQECFAFVPSGTTTDGEWSCTIVFPEFAASGRWDLTVETRDVAGNQRYYFRRPSDGFLCYYDVASSTQVCADFGDTDLILD